MGRDWWDSRTSGVGRVGDDFQAPGEERGLDMETGVAQGPLSGVLGPELGWGLDRGLWRGWEEWAKLRTTGDTEAARGLKQCAGKWAGI